MRKNFTKAVTESSKKASPWKEEAKKRQESSVSRKRARLVALRVLEALDEKGMTQSDLADKLGVSRQHISQIVKGQGNFSFDSIAKLEAALDIELMTIHGPGETVICTRKEDNFSEVKLEAANSHLIPTLAIDGNHPYDSVVTVYYCVIDNNSMTLPSTRITSQALCELNLLHHTRRFNVIASPSIQARSAYTPSGLAKQSNYMSTKAIPYRQLETS